MRRAPCVLLSIIILMMGGMETRADIFNGRSESNLIMNFGLHAGAAWKAEIRVGPFEAQTVRVFSQRDEEPDPSPIVIQFLDAETGEELIRSEVRSQGEDFLVEVQTRFRIRVTRPSELGGWFLRMEFLGHQPFVAEPLDVGLSWGTTIGFNRVIPSRYRWIMYGEPAEGITVGVGSDEGDWYGGGLVTPPECPCVFLGMMMQATGRDLERVYTSRFIGYTDMDVSTPTPTATPTRTPRPTDTATPMPTSSATPTTTFTHTPTPSSTARIWSIHLPMMLR